MKRSANAEALDHIKRGLEDCRGLAKLDEPEATRLELELLRKLSAPLIAVAGWSSPDLEKIYARAPRSSASCSSRQTQSSILQGAVTISTCCEARCERPMQSLIACLPWPIRRAIRKNIAPTSSKLRAQRGWRLSIPGRYGEARALLEQMRSLYGTSKHARHAFYYTTEPAVMAQSYLAWMDTIEGHDQSSKTRIADALARAKRLGHAFSLCYG